MPIQNKIEKHNKDPENKYGFADILISIEGQCGAGKTRIANYLTGKLKDIGYDCYASTDQIMSKRHNTYGILYDEIHIFNAQEITHENINKEL